MKHFYGKWDSRLYITQELKRAINLAYRSKSEEIE
jgi:hypothetical protein